MISLRCCLGFCVFLILCPYLYSNQWAYCVSGGVQSTYLLSSLSFEQDAIGVLGCWLCSQYILYTRRWDILRILIGDRKSVV